MTRWQQLAGPEPGAAYAARIAEHVAAGGAVHGEADFCLARLSRPGAPSGGPAPRVLDAGCGTGRVAIRLAEQGCTMVGVDADASMIEEARRQRPDLDWRVTDLAGLVTADEPAFDLVACAGNVIPLLTPGSLGPVLGGLAAALRPGGYLVTGFGLDVDHLPDGCPVTRLAAFDAAAFDAGLHLVERWATWERDPWSFGAGYAVSVHRRPAPVRR